MYESPHSRWYAKTEPNTARNLPSERHLERPNHPHRRSNESELDQDADDTQTDPYSSLFPVSKWSILTAKKAKSHIGHGDCRITCDSKSNDTGEHPRCDDATKTNHHDLVPFVRVYIPQQDGKRDGRKAFHEV